MFTALSLSWRANQIEKNTFLMQRAVNNNNWPLVASLARRQERLVAKYGDLDGASEEHLMDCIARRGRVVFVTDDGDDYMDWVSDELLKRGFIVF